MTRNSVGLAIMYHTRLSLDFQNEPNDESLQPVTAHVRKTSDPFAFAQISKTKRPSTNSSRRWMVPVIHSPPNGA